MKQKEELKNLRSKSKNQLYSELNKSYNKIRELRFGLTFRKLKDVRQAKKIRKKIAQIWSILAEEVNK